MKLIYLIGLPGTGKSTVMKAFMERVGEWKQEKLYELLDAHTNKNLVVLGKYEEGETFSGTDRLSMAVSPKAIEWVESMGDSGLVVIGEGDRLNNKGFFNSFNEKVIIHLNVSDEERLRRYKERGSNQSEKFIQTVRSKCRNIIEDYGTKHTLFGEEKGCIEEFIHDTKEDTMKIVDFILDYCQN